MDNPIYPIEIIKKFFVAGLATPMTAAVGLATVAGTMSTSITSTLVFGYFGTNYPLYSYPFTLFFIESLRSRLTVPTNERTTTKTPASSQRGL